MARLTIVNGWHDDNKGDSAIVIATMRLLQKRQGNLRLGLVSELDLGPRDFSHAYRHVLSSIGPVMIAPRILPSYSASSRLLRYPSALSFLARFLIEAAKVSPSSNNGRELISESDLVISKGGHMLYARKSNPIHWANLYSHLYPLVLSNKYNVPFAIWGHSLGPFVDRFSVRLTARVLSKAEIVAVREKISYDIALQMGIPKETLRLIPDPAFAILPNHSGRLTQVMQNHDLVAGDFISVTVRPWRFISYQVFERYIGAVADICKRLIRRNFVRRVAVVVHTMGPTVDENDLLASKMLLDSLRDFPVSLVCDDLSPEELCALYGQSRFVIGTRFHSVIMALAAGTPVYAISYFGPKALGMMQDLGMGGWVTTLDGLKVDEVVDKILGTDLDGKGKEILKTVNKYRDTLDAETKLMMTLLRAGRN